MRIRKIARTWPASVCPKYSWPARGSQGFQEAKFAVPSHYPLDKQNTCTIRPAGIPIAPMLPIGVDCCHFRQAVWGENDSAQALASVVDVLRLDRRNGVERASVSPQPFFRAAHLVRAPAMARACSQFRIR